MRRLAVLAQWSKTGDLPPHVAVHLERLRPHTARLVLVTNSPLDAVGRARAKITCDAIIERENRGFDFAAWRDALAQENVSDFEEILLTNSSVIGPLFDLGPAFDRMFGVECDFWGMTENHARRRHLQSYFLVFRRRVIESKIWQDFWLHVPQDLSKRHTISRLEIRLTSHFEAAGFRSAAFQSGPIDPHRRSLMMRRLNYRLPLWVPANRNRTDLTRTSPLLLIKNGMPYLKASIVWGEAKRLGAPLQEIKELPCVQYPWADIGL